jgi:hypothetical protein
MGWFNTGQEAIAKVTAKSGGSWSDRFFVKSAGEAVIAFVDGENPADDADPDRVGHFKEHMYTKLDGSWSNYASCTGPATCLLCKSGLKPYDAWPFTVIQIRPTWKGKDGVEHSNDKKLMIVKKEAMQKVLRYIASKRGLTGTVWSVYRSGDKAYTIGDDWQFLKKIGADGMTPAQRRIEMAKPFQIEVPQKDGTVANITVTIPSANLVKHDYETALKPKTEAEWAADGVDVAATKSKADSYGKDGAKGGSSGGTKRGSAEVDYSK